MSRRTIISLAASIIVGIACMRPFQLTPSHIAPAWVVLAFITVAFTMVRPYAAEWR